MSEVKPKPAINIRRIIIFLIIAVLLILFISGVVSPTGVWNLILLEPIMNFLVLLSKYLLGNFGVAIIILTIIIRLITMPLTMSQLRSSKAMQALQPKMKELQKKYGNDQQKLGQETMKLYKEEGISPAGCIVPMLVQFPIWIALYQSVVQALAYTPENLVGLSKQLYSWGVIQAMVPLNHHFLWLDLTKGNFYMAIIVAASMWVLQKMSTTPSLDPSQQSMTRMMTWTMPLLFGVMAMTLPSGLSLYWVASNVLGIVIQYRVTGWGDLKRPSLASLSAPFRRKPPQSVATSAKVEEASGKGTMKGASTQLGKVGASGASPDPKEAAGGDRNVQRKKDRHGKRRGKRKN
jgi:YidC/Oxa1 family membrane protein insertase